MFISFDLVNSTSYKSQNHNWPEVFSSFMESCSDNLKKCISEEIIVYDENKNKLFNVVTVEETPYKKILDFLGPDIDTGFRIAKYVSPGKLVIDAYLAWYIAQYDGKQSDNITEKMRIVSLEDLKGVWNGRRYPIVWYNDNWTDGNSIFQYDEEYNSEIVKRIKEKGINSLQKPKVLDKILEEVNLLNYAKQFDESIKKYSEKPIILNPELSPKRAELHLVAICKNTENKILIFKRSNKRSYLPDCWEFGCTYLKYEQNIFNSLKIGYKEKYNIPITIDEQLMPVACYEAQQRDLRIPGFIYHATIECDVKIVYDPEKYSDHKLVDITDISEIKESEAVPGFHIRIKEYLDFA